VELGFKRFSGDRTTWRSAGICGAPCPISCPSRKPLGEAGEDGLDSLDIGPPRRLGHNQGAETVDDVAMPVWPVPSEWASKTHPLPRRREIDRDVIEPHERRMDEPAVIAERAL